jgi:putative membrane protein
MQRAADFFTEDDRKRINRAVADAESRTSAEIVPAVATSSGRYDRPEDIVGLWTGLVALAVVWLVLPRESGEPGSWGGMPTGVALAALIAAVLVGFIAGAVLGSRVAWLRRLFTPGRQMREEVFTRAREVFFDNRVHHTAGASGLLIYVSFFERMAAVIGDQAVLEKVGQPALDEWCGQLTARLATQTPTEAICGVLVAAGEQLAAALPRAGDDVNELSDALVVLD